jgi:hypothetical protein
MYHSFASHAPKGRLIQISLRIAGATILSTRIAVIIYNRDNNDIKGGFDYGDICRY